MSKKRKKRKVKVKYSTAQAVDDDTDLEIDRPEMVEDHKCPHSEAASELKVVIDPEVWGRIQGLTKSLNSEWMGYLDGYWVNEQEGEDTELQVDSVKLMVTGLVVPEQDVTGSTADSREDPHVVLPSHVGWVHSHNSMGAFWSDTDMGTICQHKFAIVVNKSDEYKAVLVIDLPCGLKALVVPKVEVGVSDTLTNWVSEVKPKIHEKSYSQQGSGYSGQWSLEGHEGNRCPWEHRKKKARKKCPVKCYTKCKYQSEDCPFRENYHYPSGYYNNGEGNPSVHGVEAPMCHQGQQLQTTLGTQDTILEVPPVAQTLGPKPQTIDDRIAEAVADHAVETVADHAVAIARRKGTSLDAELEEAEWYRREFGEYGY